MYLFFRVNDTEGATLCEASIDGGAPVSEWMSDGEYTFHVADERDEVCIQLKCDGRNIKPDKLCYSGRYSDQQSANLGKSLLNLEHISLFFSQAPFPFRNHKSYAKKKISCDSRWANPIPMIYLQLVWMY